MESGESGLRERMRENVLRGEAVTAFEMIDCHAHLGYWHNFNIPARTAANMVRLMDRVGIRCCVASAHASISTDYRLGNTQVTQAMRESPGRIYGYCGINPNWPASEIRNELKRCFDSGMIAIKLHPQMHRYPVDGPGYAPAWEYANKHGLCVLSHTDTSSAQNRVTLFNKLASDYPNAKIILGHSGFGYEGARQSIELVRKRSNVYLDIAASICEIGLVEMLVEGAGAERVLFGTDLPFLDCRPQIGRVAFSRLDDDSLRLVLGKNARRLFGL